MADAECKHKSICLLPKNHLICIIYDSEYWLRSILKHFIHKDVYIKHSGIVQSVHSHC